MDNDRFHNMFEDSNDSFEIPETQADPPRDHISDELDSEGYVAVPDEEIQTNDCSQSQVVLQGFELENHTRNADDFDDSDNIDLEMSKLQWDDSTKENDKNKSASVTPDLDFPAMQASTHDTERACVTPDLDFTGLSSTIANVIETLNSPNLSKGPNQSARSDQMDVRNKVSSCSNMMELQ